MLPCARCGRESPEGFRFCGGCGAALAVEGSAAREERKVVSVLFCDLVGSTAQAARMDPEDVHIRLSRYHGRVRSELERFGGVVEKFIGDAVVGLFGAPTAHGDDPERAVRAALSIRDWAGGQSDFQVRIGVNTGEALIALAARPEAGEGMASGDVVNVAARLQAAAPVNGILVGAQAYRATERVIEYRSAEPVAAKGKEAPVAVWEVVRPRSQLGIEPDRVSSAPLIGRSAELELLLSALEHACDARGAQLVTLVGAPGIGKSRLLRELVAGGDRGDSPVKWLHGRSLPYGEGVSYWALGEMVKALLGMLDTDAPSEAGAKLARGVRERIADGADADWIESHLRRLVGLAASEEVVADRRGEAFAAWRRFFEAVAEQRPLALVFEDLHWADDGLLDFIEELVDRATAVPLVLVASARPELLERRPSWSEGKPNASTIGLAALSNEDTARLVGALLERSKLPTEVQATLLERAGGNPLYAEEFVRMVTARGSAGLELPESVQGLIAARLDALAPDDKSLLQSAAVIGKVFWSGALAAVAEIDRFSVEQRLLALERGEFVREVQRGSMAGEREYMFDHVLVRDVAYGAIPRAVRAQRHRRAAVWIESLGRPEDHADMLAHHYLAALELSRAATVDIGPLVGSAAGALWRAGDRAFGLNAFARAVRLYDEALTLGVPSEGRPQILYRLGVARWLAGDDRHVAALEQARDALLAAGDPDAAAEASATLSEAHWRTGAPRRAENELERARELLRGRGPTRAAARVLAQRARLAMVAGHNEEAIRTGAEALRLAEQLGLDELVPSALQSIGVARAATGDVAAGIADLERAIETAARANNPDAARAYNNLAASLSERGELERAEALLEEGLRVADRLGNATIARFMRMVLSVVRYYRGRWEEALRGADELIAECEAGSPHYLESQARQVSARIRLARDDPEAATIDIARALEQAREGGEAQSLVPVLAAAVQVHAELGRDAEATAAVRELLSVYRGGFGSSSFVDVALNAERLELAGEVRAAFQSLGAAGTVWADLSLVILAADFERAADLLAKCGNVVGEADARLRAAASLLAAGQTQAADEQLARALSFFRSVGATRYIREAEALLAAGSRSPR